MNPAPPVMRIVSVLASCALRVLQCKLQLFGERLDGRAATLPGAVGLEPEIADASAPRRDHTADRPEVRALCVLLVEPADHIGCNTDERPQSGRGSDAVLPPVPGRSEHNSHLLEVVHEELPRLLVRIARLL